MRERPVTEARSDLAEKKRRRAAALRDARARLRDAKARLRRLERLARVERDRWAGVVRALRAGRKRLAGRRPEAVRSVVVAERELQAAELAVRNALARLELFRPGLAKGTRRGGRTTAERRAEWIERASYDLDATDRALFAALARSQRIRRGPGAGKRWIDGATPDRGRELWGEWVEDHADEYQRARSEAGDDSAADLAAAQARYEAEASGYDWTAEDERQLRALYRKPGMRKAGKAPPKARRARAAGDDEVPF